MKHTVTYSERNNIVQFKISGQKTNHFIQHTSEALAYIASECNKQALDTIVIHCAVEGNISVLECYDLSNNLEKFGFKRTTAIAFLIKDEKKKHLNNFRETVAVNRGWVTKFFTDENEAYAWLFPLKALCEPVY